MSKKYPVAFKHSPDSGVDREVVGILERIVPLVVGGDQGRMYFIFRVLRRLEKAADSPSEIDAKENYEKYLGFSRKLSSQEELLCSLLQQVLNSVVTIDRWVKAHSYLFELIVIEGLKASYQNCQVVGSANLYIKDSKFDYDGVRTTDVGVDGLDTENKIAMCECTMSLTAFTRKDKQLRFYCEAFKAIRGAVGPKPQLIFEIAAADSRGLKWEDYMPPTFARIEGLGIVVSPRIQYF